MPKRRAPWATWYPIPGLAGGPITGSARKGLLHSTQSSGLPNWHAIRSVPHLTVNPTTGEAWQHLDFDRSGYALASPGGGRSPNMNAGINIQIEVIGFAETILDQPDAWYKRLAVWMTWLSNEWGIPKDFPFSFGGEEAYGVNGPYRQPWETFRDASGWVCHQNAPYNAHWDAPFDQRRLDTYMGEGETVMALTDQDLVNIVVAVNKGLGDWTAEGNERGKDKPPMDGDPDAKPERADLRLRQIEKVVRRIERKVDGLSG